MDWIEVTDTSDIIIGEAPEAARFRALLTPTAEDLGFEIVRVRFQGGENRRTLQIMAERPDGTMNIDGCTDLSRALSAVLDVEDPIEAAYDLEVSSPGIDRPLTRPKDFDRYAGFDARIETATPVDGRRRFKGVIEGTEDGEVLMRVYVEGETEPQVLGFAFGLLSDAKLILTDELIRHDLAQKPQDKEDFDEDTDVILDKSKLN
jgi:ribosome maturation factor RimP